MMFPVHNVDLIFIMTNMGEVSLAETSLRILLTSIILFITCHDIFSYYLFENAFSYKGKCK